MGASYGAFHVRTQDGGLVKDAVTALAATGQTTFFVAPARGAWTSVYPSGHGQDPEVARMFAEATGLDVLHLLVHDDELFVYQLYRNRTLVDGYCSDPDYFEEVSAAEHARTAGHPEAFAEWLNGAEDVARLADLLRRRERRSIEETVAAVLRTGRFEAAARMLKMAALLGIANLETCYEYIRQRETRGVKGASAFVHVPDLAEEKARKRQATAEWRALQARLRADGLLLASERRKGSNRLFSPQPVMCAAPLGGFLVAWSEGHADARVAVEAYRSPWRAVPLKNGLQVPSTVRVMAVSARGTYLAAGHAYGRWLTELYALADGRRLCDLPQERAVDSVGFTPDERWLLSRSVGVLHVVSTESGEVVRRIEVDAGQGNACAVHPDGRWAAADVTGGHGAAVAVLDLTGEERPRLLATPRHDLAAWMARAARGEATTGFEPQDVPRALAFTPDGRHLAIAVSQGVRAYAWEDVLRAQRDLPPPVAHADTVPVRMESSWLQFTYAVCPDGRRSQLLFSGLDGCVRALDLATGAARILVEVPERPALLRLELSPDARFLATVASPNLHDRSKLRRFVLGIWDYARLLERPTPGETQS
jgi:hypothetical protein